jgi:histone deacetylase 6
MASSYIGEGKGKYFNVNIAWETNTVVDEVNRLGNQVSELGNNEYKYACDNLLLPMVSEFNPDIILVSCGFDGAIHDYLGWCNLSPMLYAYMTFKLMNICPRILVVQEGGYNVEYLG